MKLWKLILIIQIAIIVTVGVLWILAIILYGGKPITEIPMWAWLFLK